MLTKKRIAVLLALIAAASFAFWVKKQRYSGEQDVMFKFFQSLATKQNLICNFEKKILEN